MIRATIIVKTPNQLKRAFKMLHGRFKNYKIVKIKNNLTRDIANINLNFVYYDSIIGEIQIRVGSKPINYYANHFMYELERVDSVTQLR